MASVWRMSSMTTEWCTRSWTTFCTMPRRSKPCCREYCVVWKPCCRECSVVWKHCCREYSGSLCCLKTMLSWVFCCLKTLLSWVLRITLLFENHAVVSILLFENLLSWVLRITLLFENHAVVSILLFENLLSWVPMLLWVLGITLFGNHAVIGTPDHSAVWKPWCHKYSASHCCLKNHAVMNTEDHTVVWKPCCCEYSGSHRCLKTMLSWVLVIPASVVLTYFSRSQWHQKVHRGSCILSAVPAPFGIKFYDLLLTWTESCTRWSAYGLFRTHRNHLELNWIEQNHVRSVPHDLTCL